MAGYVSSSLIAGEEVQYHARLSVFSLWPQMCLGLLLLPLWGIGFLFWIAAAVRFFTTELAVTNKRVIAKFGLISRQTVELHNQKIEAIRVDQSILGRLLDYGSVYVSGAGTPQAPIRGISRPLDFRRAFVKAQEAALDKRSA